MAEIFLDCLKCEHCYAVTVCDEPDYLPELIHALARRDGYICHPCANLPLEYPPFVTRYATEAEIERLEAEEAEEDED